MPYNDLSAKVAELADAPDLGSGPARGGGSNPPFRTTFAPQLFAAGHPLVLFEQATVVCGWIVQQRTTRRGKYKKEGTAGPSFFWRARRDSGNTAKGEETGHAYDLHDIGCLALFH